MSINGSSLLPVVEWDGKEKAWKGTVPAEEPDLAPSESGPVDRPNSGSSEQSGRPPSTPSAPGGGDAAGDGGTGNNGPERGAPPREKESISVAPQGAGNGSEHHESSHGITSGGDASGGGAHGEGGELPSVVGGEVSPQEVSGGRRDHATGSRDAPPPAPATGESTGDQNAPQTETTPQHSASREEPSPPLPESEGTQEEGDANAELPHSESAVAPGAAANTSTGSEAETPEPTLSAGGVGAVGPQPEGPSAEAGNGAAQPSATETPDGHHSETATNTPPGSAKETTTPPAADAVH
ncbi:surface protease GP63 [Trypanosoma rangeli]|uniref:Surface protease GP63 n=1 Tax=Trypanosoma rangeli TaxID=5698 RepID=A0A3R7JV12_TRYRA|nr:surface protease GP63 [Trypanosoma rangeli]RNE95914.1 surface protease GP63 [Trypanosoma rangeli]|eukprot:RNE95914.1 surface protease GP63 [Trypanosoma rangeli]